MKSKHIAKTLQALASLAKKNAVAPNLNPRKAGRETTASVPNIGRKIACLLWVLVLFAGCAARVETDGGTADLEEGDTPMPDVSAPDVNPDIPAADVFPDAPAPDVSIPDTPIPDVSTPDVNPDVSAVDVSPDTPAPDTPAPDVPSQDPSPPALSCNNSAGVWRGNVMTQAQYETAQHCKVVEGNIEIRVSPFEDLSAIVFPNLTRVEGEISISGLWGNTGTISAVRFPKLVEVGKNDGIGGGQRSITIENNLALASIEFPELLRAPGRVSIEDNEMLTAIVFPKLQRVGISLGIGGNGSPFTLDFPALQESGLISIGKSDTDVIQHVVFPKLSRVTDGSISVGAKTEVVRFPALTELHGRLSLSSAVVRVASFPKLSRVHGGIDISESLMLAMIEFPVLEEVSGQALYPAYGIVIDQNREALRSIAFPQLLRVPHGIWLEKNDVLRSLSMPKLAQSGTIDLHVDEHPLLVYCELGVYTADYCPE